jgi:hypothetical protein
MQHLGDRRAHAQALAGGQYDDQKRMLGHVGGQIVLQLLVGAPGRGHATCMPGRIVLICVAICGPKATSIGASGTCPQGQ